MCLMSDDGMILMERMTIAHGMQLMHSGMMAEERNKERHWY